MAYGSERRPALGETIQYFAGMARTLNLHIPLGVVLVTGAVVTVPAIWRPGARGGPKPMTSDHMSRRTFLALTGGAGLVAAAGVTIPRIVGGPGETGKLLRSTARLRARFQVPLPIPRTLKAVSRAGDHDQYSVTQRAATAEILPGLRTPIWGYEGTFPGPTIETRSGRAVVVRHRNELPVPTVVHLHGGRTPADSDGYPTDMVLPMSGWTGAHEMDDPSAQMTHGERDYTFPLQQHAATLWYHDHRMDFTGPAVYRGLAGFHLVRDEEEDALGLPSGDHEIPLMITDRTFNEDGSFRYPSIDPTLRTTPGVEDPYAAGVFGDVILVNGAPWPVHEVTATRHRLRILNGSNARRYDLALDPPPPGGDPFIQIGSDQGLLAAPRTHYHLPIGPAERYDIVLDFGRYPPGSHVTLINRLGAGAARAVMRFQITHRAPDDSRVPAKLGTIEPLHRSQAVATREFSFRAGLVHGHPGWVIGGRPFSPSYVEARPRLGAVEIWRFVADALTNFRLSCCIRGLSSAVRRPLRSVAILEYGPVLGVGVPCLAGVRLA